MKTEETQEERERLQQGAESRQAGESDELESELAALKASMGLVDGETSAGGDGQLRTTDREAADAEYELRRDAAIERAEAAAAEVAARGDELYVILAEQHETGAFLLSPELTRWIGDRAPELDGWLERWGEPQVATALAIALMVIEAAEQREVWREEVDRARAYLRRQPATLQVALTEQAIMMRAHPSREASTSSTSASSPARQRR